MMSRAFPLGGRHLAAYLGLTPREHSSGGRRRLGRISKQGDVYLRMLLIHGARAVLQGAQPKSDPDRFPQVGSRDPSAAAVTTRLPLPSPTKWPASFGPFGNLANRSSPDLKLSLMGYNCKDASRLCLVSVQRHWGNLSKTMGRLARRPTPRLIVG